MCFLGDNFIATPKVAKEDINVYKIVYAKNDTVISAYMFKFHWTMGKVYHTDMRTFVDKNIEIEVFRRIMVDEGFHSFSEDKTTVNAYRNFYGEDMVAVDKNINDLDKARLDWYRLTTMIDGVQYRIALMKCIIPKGSDYFENRHGEIVSNTIKPISYEIIDSPKIGKVISIDYGKDYSYE